MDSWRKYLELRVRAKTGLSSAVLIWALLALLGGILTFVFLLVTAYVWLAERYEPLLAALILGGLFLLLTIVALVACIWSHNKVIERAELQLAMRKSNPWLEPRVVAGALQASRAVGGPKLLAVVAAAFLAAGIGM